MSSGNEVLTAMANGTADQLTDWSTGGTPGSGISQVDNAGADSPTTDYTTYLQGLEQAESSTTDEDSPSSSADPAVGKTAATVDPSLPAKEELLVTLENGRKAKITADYSDREKIKKAYEMAAGMRKFQAERDQERMQAKQLQAQYGEIREVWDKLEDAYQSGGIEGLIDLLEGRPGAHSDYVSKQIERHLYKESLSPAEKAQLEYQERLESNRRAEEARDRIRRQELERMEARVAEADEKETRALITPSFERYRFKGKLGDPVAEHHFDQAVWMQALTNLEQFDESDITPDLVDREFAKVSNAFARAAKQQATKATKQAVDTKKREAKEQAAVTAMKGMNTSGTKESDLTKRLWAGDTANVLKELLMSKRK